jgi:hypothetical protein
MRTVFEYQRTLVMVSKADDLWHVRAHGNVYRFRLLDVALWAALPSLSRRECDRLTIRVLEQEAQQDGALPDAA